MSGLFRGKVRMKVPEHQHIVVSQAFTKEFIAIKYHKVKGLKIAKRYQKYSNRKPKNEGISEVLTEENDGCLKIWVYKNRDFPQLLGLKYAGRMYMGQFHGVATFLSHTGDTLHFTFFMEIYLFGFLFALHLLIN
ncbi:MAG TPA: hypothetical protein VIN10_00345 [Bacteroidales bacterium]